MGYGVLTLESTKTPKFTQRESLNGYHTKSTSLRGVFYIDGGCSVKICEMRHELRDEYTARIQRYPWLNPQKE